MSSVLRASVRIVGCLLSWSVFLILPDCGARTAIEMGEPCPMGATEQACEGVCGGGVSTCKNGYWSQCQVPKSEVPCSGVCGVGIKTCENGVLSECVIPPAQRDCSSVCGTGHETCVGEKWGACDAPQPKPVLRTTIRDMHRTQTDFESRFNPDRLDLGMVEPLLGADGTPVYAGRPTTPSTPGGKAGFDVWYHDTPGVNLTTSKNLQLTEDPNKPGTYSFEDRTFFPIDDELFGNEGFRNNFHFTLETHTAFIYRGGEVFTFAGDDDVWVFIAGQLVIDLGGLHTIRTASVGLDAVREKLGLIVGQRYPLDLFYAERHTLGSNFIVNTTISDVGSCD